MRLFTNSFDSGGLSCSFPRIASIRNVTTTGTRSKETGSVKSDPTRLTHSAGSPDLNAKSVSKASRHRHFQSITMSNAPSTTQPSITKYMPAQVFANWPDGSEYPPTPSSTGFEDSPGWEPCPKVRHNRLFRTENTEAPPPFRLKREVGTVAADIKPQDRKRMISKTPCAEACASQSQKASIRHRVAAKNRLSTAC